METRNPLPLLLVSNAIASIGTGVAMIAIPWMLVSGKGGAQTFGYLATIVNLVLFAGTPFIGPIIDTYSRKSLMLLLRILFVAGLMVVIGVNNSWLEHGGTIALVLYYILGSTFYAFNIPLRSAFVQQLFKPNEYLRVNSILEIENQVAAVVTGVIAISIIEQYGLTVLVTGNIAAFLVAIVCIAMIAAPANQVSKSQRKKVLAMLTEGFRISFQNSRATLLLICATIPYVVVILYTILHPVALSELPEATGRTYALVELLFGCGAILGGAVFTYWAVPRDKLTRRLEWMILLFAMVAITQGAYQTYTGFVVLAAAFGFTNAATRILRQSILMHEFDDAEVGRVGAFLQSWTMFTRSIFLAIVTMLIASDKSSDGVWFAALVACLPIIIIALHTLFQRINNAKEIYNDL